MNTNSTWLLHMKTNHTAMAFDVKFGDKEFAFKKGNALQPTQSVVVVVPPAETKKEGDVLTPLSATASIVASLIAIFIGVRHFMRKKAIEGLTV
jgi:hypothetical protein